MRPLCIDLFCGLGGWAEGFLAEGYDVIGFDIERHRYWLPEAMSEGEGQKGTNSVAKRGWTQGCAVSMGLEGATAQPRTRLAQYPGQLVIQDVLTLHGKQFRNADIIVASPPCQEYSYMAMPWTRAKQIALALRGHGEFPEGHTGSKTIAQLTALFDACFRLQREACIAAGRFIPMVVENVRGARPWVGRSQWNFGSYHLWGDVPALMPITSRAQKFNPDGTNHGQGSWFAVADSTNRGSSQGLKWGDCNGKVFSERPKGNVAAHREGTKVPSFQFDGNGGSFQSAAVDECTKLGGSWFHGYRKGQGPRNHASHSHARKAASAQIAKIPFALSSHIARVYKPDCEAVA